MQLNKIGASIPNFAKKARDAHFMPYQRVRTFTYFFKHIAAKFGRAIALVANK